MVRYTYHTLSLSGVVWGGWLGWLKQLYFAAIQKFIGHILAQNICTQRIQMMNSYERKQMIMP